MFYGWRSKDLGQVQVPGACPSCGTEGSVALHVIQKYAHILFIPAFPLGKKAVTVCAHCKQVLEGGELSPSGKVVFQSSRGQFSTPVWMFSGLVVIALLIPLAIWQSDRYNAKVLARLNAPTVGDLYDIKLGTRSYTFYRVERIAGDSIYTSIYNYETNKTSGLRELLDKNDGGFSEELIGYSRADVLAMREDGMIVGVREN